MCITHIYNLYYFKLLEIFLLQNTDSVANIIHFKYNIQDYNGILRFAWANYSQCLIHTA